MNPKLPQDYKDPFYISYSGYSTRSNNFSNAGPHQVHVKNNTLEDTIEVLEWTVTKGRLEENFTKNTIRPCLFNTAKLVPITWAKDDPVVAAVVFKGQGTNLHFTLAFEDPYNGTKEGYKGIILEGNNPKGAIEQLADSSPKELPWGRYYTDEVNGRLRTVIQFTDIRQSKQ